MAQTKEEKRAYNQAYYRRNRDKLIAREKQRYRDNIEAITARRKEFYAENREEILAKQRQYYLENCERIRARERSKAKHRRRYANHGITKSDFEDLLEKQNGVCAICRRECDVASTLSIDHNHDTGAIRGLLCRRCNSGLGFFRDSHELLDRASEYLQSEEAMKQRKKAA